MTNIVDESNGAKKVWAFTQISPCVHNEGHVWAVQTNIGYWVTVEGLEVFRDSDHPKQTRVVYMKMDEQGKLSNVHSAYNGPKLYKS